MLPRALPYAAPRWALEPRGTSYAAIGIVGTTAAAATLPAVALLLQVLGHLPELQVDRASPWTVLCTSLIAMVVAHRTLRTRRTEHAIVLAILGGALAATLDLCLIAIPSLVLDGLWRSLGIALIGTMTGGPLGCLAGLAFAPMVSIARGAQRRVSHDSIDRVVAAGATASSVLLAAVGLSVEAFWAVPRMLVGAAHVADVVASVAAMVALAATIRLALRHRWLTRVRRELVSDWRLVPAGGAGSAERLAWYAVDAGREAVLTIDLAASGEPYRDSDRAIAVARVGTAGDDGGSGFGR